MSAARQANLDVRLVVVAPTFDNAATLRALLEGVAAHGLPIIVTDDGSTDGTRAILASWRDESAGRWVVTHDANCGKAAALRSGFARAEALGFTHALTIDTDGQHDPADVPSIVRLSVADRRAIVLGARPIDGPGYPTRSRVGRWFSNALVWFIGGVRVSDSQCGMRIYPLDVVRTLGAETSRYAFETEVLARAGWANVPVAEVPIRCIYELPTGRVTHFRPWRDSFSAAWMHTRLIARSLYFWPPRKVHPTGDETTTGTLVERTLRWSNPMRTWRLIRRDAVERERVAASAGLGLFVGCQPAFGLKTILCLAAARGFNLQPLVVLTASSLTTPPVGLFVWAASIAIGHALLHGSLPSPDTYDIGRLGPAAVLRLVAAEWIIGAIVFGAAIGASAWLLLRLIVRRMPIASR